MSFENAQPNPEPDQAALEVPGSSKPVGQHEGTSTELEKYWKVVKDNPSDFTGWTYLLQFVEQDGNLETSRPAFDAFLERYPYCYGYWKKYTDMEKKHAMFDEAEQALDALRITVTGFPTFF
ncbi:hypothetical protein LSH36_264g01032 [Paralvinella palmiformis]|uniref:Pre-mRNA-processing factor 39 n=1 Tax=Paralvinella palmiformis TaxID=53620 RepID=A0AAD9N3Z4_9ANNE|nr:hypothetical protein LSH36_264g01032 [Paralvinella palmiformis]